MKNTSVNQGLGMTGIPCISAGLFMRKQLQRLCG
jgi:hypothetical protein